MRGGWIPTYNKELDYFAWTKPVLSKDSRLVKISHDVLLHFTKKGAVEGLDLEYLKGNFIEHNPDFKDFPELFTEKADKSIFTIPKEKQGTTEGTFRSFMDKVRTDIYEDTLNDRQSIDELEDLVDTALKS